MFNCQQSYLRSYERISKKFSLWTVGQQIAHEILVMLMFSIPLECNLYNTLVLNSPLSVRRHPPNSIISKAGWFFEWCLC